MVNERSGSARPSSWRWWPDATLLAVGALLVRIPAMFAPTQLGYDDGGYGLAVVAMRQGFEPFRDIFSPQGPLFLPLLRAADLIGLEHRNSPRLAAVLAGVVVTLAVYAIGIQLFDRGRALLAGGLIATSGVLLWTTGPITGDGPAAAFVTTAVAVAVAYRRTPSPGRALAITALAGAAVSTKSLLVGPGLLVALILVASRRRWLHVAMIPVGAALIVTALAAPWGFDHVLDDYVRYHLDKTSNRRPGANLNKIVTTFFDRDPLLVALAAIALATPVIRRFARRPARSPVLLGAAPAATPDPPQPDRAGRFDAERAGFLWVWFAAAAIVLIAQDPMFRNHLSALVAPSALLVARFRPSWRVIAAAAAIAIPFQAVELRPLLWPEDFRGPTAQIVAEMRRLPRDTWIISDTPGLVWRAGQATNPFYVDPSVLRLDSTVGPIRITEARVIAAARDPRVCAVAITAPVRFGRYDGLPAALRGLGYERTVALAGRMGLYVRPDCRT